MNEAVLCLMGPTASGKTDLAIRLAQKFPIEIISVDSALIYREMNIGTAKPDLSEQRGVPHHLLNLINPDESYSVAQFCQDARDCIEAIRERNHTPLLVGGTMMYFKALQQGLATLPAANNLVRMQLDEEARHLGWPVLHARLQTVDPVMAAQIKPQDQQRIQRALEVFMLTNTPMSELQQQSLDQAGIDCVNILLIPENRAWLHERIARRFKQMLSQGFIKEVQSILQRWPQSIHSPSMRMVGYRQALECMQQGNEGEFEAKALAATRQLAKRQITWLRHWPNGQVFDPQSTHIVNAINNYIQSLDS